MWKDELTLKGGKEDPYTIRCVVVPKVSKCENCPATFDKVSNLKVHITNKHCRSSATSVRKRCSVNVTWKNTFRHSQRAHEFSKNCQRLHCILPMKWAPNWLALHSLWFIGYKLFKTYQAHDKTQPHVISAIMRSTFLMLWDGTYSFFNWRRKRESLFSFPCGGIQRRGHGQIHYLWSLTDIRKRSKGGENKDESPANPAITSFPPSATWTVTWIGNHGTPLKPPYLQFPILILTGDRPLNATRSFTFISKSFYWKPMYYKEYSTFSNGTFECVCSVSLCWWGYDGTSYMGFPPICLRSGTLPPSDGPCNFLIAADLRVSPDGFPRRWTSLFCWGFLFPRC